MILKFANDLRGLCGDNEGARRGMKGAKLKTELNGLSTETRDSRIGQNMGLALETLCMCIMENHLDSVLCWKDSF